MHADIKWHERLESGIESFLDHVIREICLEGTSGVYVVQSPSLSGPVANTDHSFV